MPVSTTSLADGTLTFLPHRLNRQPVVVRGLTADELWICAGLSGLAGLILGMPLAWVAQSIALPPTCIVGAVALCVFTSESVPTAQAESPSTHSKPDEALMDFLPVCVDEAPLPGVDAEDVSNGQAFLQWLKKSIRSRRLIVNDAKALVHTVADTLYLVTPSIFQRYCREHPNVARLAKQDQQQDWELLQRQFERQRAHRKQPNGLNIWSCQVTGPRRSTRLHAYLLKEPKDLMGDIALNNPHLQLLPPDPEPKPTAPPVN